MPFNPSDAAIADLEQVADLLDHLEQVEAQLEQVRQGLTQSHRLTTLGTLTAVVAHEYNNILTPIISYAQLAQANPEDIELQHKAVARALDAAQRAADISASVLGFASANANESAAHLPTVVDQSLKCLARAPDKDGITLEIDTPDLTLAISPVALQQVLVNLILNARKAMRRRGGVLSIRAQPQGDAVRITVSDTGPGIPPAIRSRLFEPFVTSPTDAEASEDSAAAKPGTGLGLCICRDLLTAARGHITVDSPPGRGAAFQITLPLA